MEIDQLVVGMYQTNCYVLRESITAKECLIIDTGLEAGPVVDFLNEHKLNPAAVILTHGHADHIAGLGILREKYPDTKVYIHKLDAQMLTDKEQNLSALAGIQFSAEPADVLIEEGDMVEEAGIKLAVLHTPGHTQGGVSLYSKDEQIIFVGDTLFADSIGRADFPGGNMEQLITSIREKLLGLPEETAVYPGHGPITTIRQEKAYNPFLQ